MKRYSERLGSARDTKDTSGLLLLRREQKL